MHFLLNELTQDHTSADGLEVYRDPAGDRVVRVDQRAGRAVVSSAGAEAVLLRDAAGAWVPEHDDWTALARVLGAPALARATHGF